MRERFFEICINTAGLIGALCVLFIPFLQNPIVFFSAYTLYFMYSFTTDKNVYSALFEKNIYNKILSSLIGFSLLVISIIFSLHTDYLTKFDTPDTGNKFQWFSPINVLKFPEENLRLSNNYLNRILLDKNEKPKTLNLIFIDNSASANKNKVSDNILNEINLKYNYPINNKRITTSNQIISIKLLDQLSQGNNDGYMLYVYSDSSKIAYNPIVFDQNNILTSKYYKDKSRTCNDTLIKILKKNPNKKSYTSIENFIDIESIIRDKNYGKEFKFLKIFIISDFKDNDLKCNFKKFNKLVVRDNIVAVNIIKSTGNDRSRRDVFSDIAEICNKYCEKTTLNTIDLNDSDNVEDYESSITKICLNDNRKYYNIQTLKFAYPFFIKQSGYVVQSKFLINKSDDLQIQIKNTDNPKSETYYETQKNNEPISCSFFGKLMNIGHVKENDTILIRSPNYNAFSNNRIELDMYSKNENTVNTFHIDLVPMLSTSTLLFMVFFYTVLISSISFIFLFAYTKTAYSQKEVHIIPFTKYVVFSSLALIPLFYYYFYSILFFDKNMGWAVLIIKSTSILIFIVTFVHYKNSLKLQGGKLNMKRK